MYEESPVFGPIVEKYSKRASDHLDGNYTTLGEAPRTSESISVGARSQNGNQVSQNQSAYSHNEEASVNRNKYRSSRNDRYGSPNKHHWDSNKHNGNPIRHCGNRK